MNWRVKANAVLLRSNENCRKLGKFFLSCLRPSARKSVSKPNRNQFPRRSNLTLSVRSPRWFGQPVPVRVEDQLEAIGKFELGENRSEVISDGCFGDEEAVGDLRAFETVGDERNNLPLALGQILNLLGFCIIGRAAGDSREDRRRQRA